MAQHTPGPWFAFDANYQRLNEYSLLPIFTIGPQEFHTVAQVRPGNDDDDLPAQTEANARLIAAAPDLLAALKALVTFDSRAYVKQSGIARDLLTIRKKAKLAIAKAEAA